MSTTDADTAAWDVPVPMDTGPLEDEPVHDAGVDESVDLIPDPIPEPPMQAAPAPEPAPVPAPAPASDAKVLMTDYVIQQAVTLKRGREDVDAWIDVDTIAVRSGNRKGAITEVMAKHSITEGTFRAIPKASTNPMTPKATVKTTIDWA
jgi:hypothetical protein